MSVQTHEAFVTMSRKVLPFSSVVYERPKINGWGKQISHAPQGCERVLRISLEALAIVTFIALAPKLDHPQ